MTPAKLNAALRNTGIAFAVFDQEGVLAFATDALRQHMNSAGTDAPAFRLDRHWLSRARETAPAASTGSLRGRDDRHLPGYLVYQSAENQFVLTLMGSRIDVAAASAALQQSWGLTASEAEVSLMAIDGAPIDAIAARRGVARETVRTQLRRSRIKAGAENTRSLAARIWALTALPMDASGS